MSLNEDMRKILLAGIGAVATSVEKSSELVDRLIKKGELTVEQGKVLNEELKRNVKERVNQPKEESSILNQLEHLSEEELAAVKLKLAELEQKEDGEKGQEITPQI